MLKFIILGVLVVAVCGSHEDHHESHPPQPYHFGYEVKDKHGSHFRKEEGDGHGQVKGSYGYTDEKGIYREVHYVADKAGFRAEIKTNEPGTTNQDPADIKMHSSAKHEEEFHGHNGGHQYAGDDDDDEGDNKYRRSDKVLSFVRRRGDHGGHD